MISLIVNTVEYPLPLQTDELQAELDALYDAGRLSELIDPHELLAPIAHDWPTPPATDWPRPRIGSLYWPVVGVGRYAFACYLIDEYSLGQIRAALTAGGANVTVYMRDSDDPAETPRSFPMQYLATRPLVRTGSGALTTSNDQTQVVDGWVILLVDIRYGQLHSALHASVSPSSWNDIFSSVYSGSITIADAVDSDYLVPSVRWSAANYIGKSGSWLLDCAALSVGSRIVNVPGSSPALQRPTATRYGALASAHNAAVADNRFIGGGPITSDDISFGQPTAIDIVFCGPTETSPAVVTVTDASPPAIGANMQHWADATIAATNGTTRAALAAQFESDWSAWQFNLYDTTYAGFVAVPASGFCWAVEYYHSATKGYTKFVRPPHWYGYLRAPQEGIAPPPTPGITVTDTHSFSQSGVTQLDFAGPPGFFLTNVNSHEVIVGQTAASQTTPGYISTGTQDIIGSKVFYSNVVINGSRVGSSELVVNSPLANPPSFSLVVGGTITGGGCFSGGYMFNVDSNFPDGDGTTTAPGVYLQGDLNAVVGTGPTLSYIKHGTANTGPAYSYIQAGPGAGNFAFVASGIGVTNWSAGVGVVSWGISGTSHPDDTYVCGLNVGGGSQSYVGTGTLNTFTTEQKIHSNVSPALELQQTVNDTSVTLQVINIANSVTFNVLGNGAIATGSTGTGFTINLGSSIVAGNLPLVNAPSPSKLAAFFGAF